MRGRKKQAESFCWPCSSLIDLIITSDSRNLYLDFLRGLFVFVMTINHLAFGASWLDYITGGGQLWFSAAEGFVLTSGIVFGLVYTRY